MRQRCGLTEGSEIADVGSGTGALARLFLKTGNRVFGVEANPEMRRAGERLSRQHGRFTSVAAPAEDTTLPDGSVDLVTAGQAFHWFDPDLTRAEFARILKPGGCAALVWNTRRREGRPFLVAYEELLQACGTDYREVYHGHRASRESIRGFFRPVPQPPGFRLRRLEGAAAVLFVRTGRGRAGAPGGDGGREAPLRGTSG